MRHAPASRRAARLLRPLLALALVAAAAPLGAQPDAATAPPPEQADPELTAKLEALVRGFGGEVGVYVRHLPTGASAAIKADTVFPTASLIKVPILLTLFDQVERGAHDLEATQVRPASLTYQYTEATDVVGYMTTGDSLPLRELVFLMLTVSDNHASLWIQALVGGGAAVNEWLAAHGYAHTRVNSRTPGREAARSAYGWGQTTPREMARAFVEIRTGRAVSPRADEAMYRMLTKTYWDREAVSQLPPTIQAASKQGFVDRARSEVLLVNAPTGDYVLAVMTKNQADTSYAASNEGLRLIRAASRTVFEHFNPEAIWRPARP